MVVLQKSVSKAVVGKIQGGKGLKCKARSLRYRTPVDEGRSTMGALGKAVMCGECTVNKDANVIIIARTKYYRMRGGGEAMHIGGAGPGGGTLFTSPVPRLLKWKNARIIRGAFLHTVRVWVVYSQAGCPGQGGGQALAPST